MLNYEDRVWSCFGIPYPSFMKAFEELCLGISADGDIPVFGNLDVSVLSPDEKRQLLMLYSIYNADLSVLIESRTYSDYIGKGPAQNSVLQKLMSGGNNIYSGNYAIPTGYMPNKGTQGSLIPGIVRWYGSRGDSYRCRNGKFPFDKILSVICDNVLLSAFKDLAIFQVLASDKRTADLHNHMCNDDLNRARVLASQVRDKCLRGDDFISIGDLRKCRYKCSPRGEGDYALRMTGIPRRYWIEDNYSMWFMQEPHPLSPPYPEEMKRVAEEYCEASGVKYSTCLREHPVRSWEIFYRALPCYIKRRRGTVCVESLRNYYTALSNTYGSCDLIM